MNFMEQILSFKRGPNEMEDKFFLETRPVNWQDSLPVSALPIT